MTHPVHPAITLPHGFYALRNPDQHDQISLWERNSGGFLPWPRRATYGPPTSDGPAYDDWLMRVALAIVADPVAARSLFAKQTIRCHVCGRKLTNKRSREFGTGPECRAGTSEADRG